MRLQSHFRCAAVRVGPDVIWTGAVADRRQPIRAVFLGLAPRGKVWEMDQRFAIPVIGRLDHGTPAWLTLPHPTAMGEVYRSVLVPPETCRWLAERLRNLVKCIGEAP